MHKHYTDSELKKALSEMVIITDTREQVNDHITGFFDKHKIPYETRKLETGDYSARLGDETLEDDVIIERKHNIDEIAGNFTSDRERFEHEWLRAKANGTKMHLIIEEASWGDIIQHNYRSKLEPKSLEASLLSWQSRYGVTITFCRKSDTARIIYGILYYSMREELLKGD